MAHRMTLVLQVHRELDAQCQSQVAAAAGFKVDKLTVADVAYPLVTDRLTAVFRQQLVHIWNGCISDDPRVSTVSKGGHNQLPLHQPSSGSLPFTAWHEQGGSCPLCSQSHLLLLTRYQRMLGYNHRCLHALGKKVPPDSMTSKVCLTFVSSSNSLFFFVCVYLFLLLTVWFLCVYIQYTVFVLYNILIT